MLTFQDLVGDTCVFARDYRDRQPLLRKRAISDPQRLLSFADLDRLLMSEAIRPPYVCVTKQGAQVREGDYTRLARVQLSHMDDIADPRKLITAFQTGATLTWNSMNHYHPPLRALTTMLSTALGCRTDVVAFATPAGIRGFAPHLDSTEVFVIQSSGTKKWTVWPTWRPRPAAGQALDADTLGEPLFSAELEPGDCLYLPWGTPHVAYSGSQVSLHLSVTAKPQSWADIITGIVASALAVDPEYAGFPVLSARPAAETVAEFRRLLEAAVKSLGDLDPPEQALTALAKEALPGYGIGTTDFFQRLEAIGHQLPPETRVRRADPESRAVIGEARDSEHTAVTIGLRTYSIATSYVSALQAINDTADIALTDLAAALGEMDIAQNFVRMLVQIGFLEAADDPTLTA